MKERKNDKGERVFVFEANCYQTLTVSELWPDGDAPENPTTADVLALVKKCGGAKQILDDWDLLYDIDLYVDGEMAR